MNRFRELAYALAFWAIRSSVFAVVAFDELRGELVEVDRELLGPVPERPRSLGRRRRGSRARRSRRITVESWSLFARICAKDAPVLGGRHEAETVGEGRGRDPRERARDRLVDGDLARARDRSDPPGVDLVEVPSDVLREQQANVAGVALELAVREGSLLERSERLHPLVRLAEDAQPEQADRDDAAPRCRRTRRAAWCGPWRAGGRRADDGLSPGLDERRSAGGLAPALPPPHGVRGSAWRTLPRSW